MRCHHKREAIITGGGQQEYRETALLEIVIGDFRRRQEDVELYSLSERIRKQNVLKY